MTEGYTDNVLRVFKRATPMDIQTGGTWYHDAYQMCLELGYYDNVHINKVAGVVAALSPNNKWDRNITDALSLMTAHHRGKGISSTTVCTYNANKQKAWDILDLNEPDPLRIRQILRGQKVTAFFDCILGDNTCVIDGHAYNIAMGERAPIKSGIRIGKKLFEELQDAYVSAASRFGLKGYQMQAITWTTWRREHNIK